MAKNDKLRIGFLLNNDDLGVIYYLLNVAKCIGTLAEGKQPTILLFFSEATKKHAPLFTSFDFCRSMLIQYPGPLEIYLTSWLFQRGNFVSTLIRDNQLDGLFPVLDLPLSARTDSGKLVAWVTDFQHKFYPELFKRKNLLLRDFRFQRVFAKADKVVLSSHDAENHLHQFYEVANDKIEVLNFVSHVRLNPQLDPVGVKEKFGISKPFFIISNQFYVHKNHIVVLEAIDHLKAKYGSNIPVDFIFTGKMQDYRDKSHISNLLNFIEKKHLGNDLKMLGLIDREEQLILMKEALAVVQPSLFEGWNTSIEDAKTLRQRVICSDIDVHREQMGDYGYYFSPKDAATLVVQLESFAESVVNKKTYPDNRAARAGSFANAFLTLFS